MKTFPEPYVTPSMLYCNGGVPPVPVAVIVPVFPLHDVGVTVAVIEGPAVLPTTIETNYEISGS